MRVYIHIIIIQKIIEPYEGKGMGSNITAITGLNIITIKFFRTDSKLISVYWYEYQFIGITISMPD